MSKVMSSYDELVDRYKNELLNDEQLMDQFEERFEERLAAKSKKKDKDPLEKYIS
ncbi:FbpB family small basic protein [Oceanobacillus senegalensis]|uniref:FbpB family small basic protein n=1 Tax=Oceanobacillus senegalensis TaxID=1936063 RepID=UPI00117F9A7C|nr:FbpB family small basic protein [Oceanobacillus senegalensis]